MSIGNVNKDEFFGQEYPFKGKLKFKEWDQKRKYEENVLLINIRALDLDGTLEVSKKEDRSLCKPIPEIDVIDGYVVIKVKREK